MIKIATLGLLNTFFNKKNEKGELPLDSSGRSRLINMRVRRQRELACLSPGARRNLITRLHSAGSPLPVIRGMASKLKKSWLLHDAIYSAPNVLISNSALVPVQPDVRMVCQSGGIFK